MQAATLRPRRTAAVTFPSRVGPPLRRGPVHVVIVAICLLWMVPLGTSFSLFMILRQIVQHENAGRDRFGNTRVFHVSAFFRFAVFPRRASLRRTVSSTASGPAPQAAADHSTTAASAPAL